MNSTGQAKAILDTTKLKEINMLTIRMIISIVGTCEKFKTHLRLIGSSDLANELKGFQETSGFAIHASVEEAKATFDK